MLRKVLVPLDGSPFAEQALPLALTVARRASARLHLVSVRVSLQLDALAPTLEDYLNALADRLEPQLPGRITRSVLTNERTPIEYPLARSTVAEVVARNVADVGVDLVIMTTHGRSGIPRAWLGSVADSLVRSVPRPILMIRPQDERFSTAHDADHGLRHILIPLDGSARAERVFEYAQQLGEAFEARYTLLRVLSPLLLTPTTEWNGSFPAVGVPLQHPQVATEYMDEVVERMRAVGMEVRAHLIESLAPGAAIVEFARTHGADLIAMSTGAAAGVRRLLLGSVADRVVRSSAVPVLVCNARTTEATSVAVPAPRLRRRALPPAIRYPAESSRQGAEQGG
ncbi:MAG TPA: universal stress protein [Longimicrobiales bacterium]